MSPAIADDARTAALELQEKLFRLANLQADKALTEQQYRSTVTQNQLAPWTLVASAFTTGAAVAGAFIAVGRWQ